MSGVIVGGKIINAKILEQKLAQAFELWAKEDVNNFFEDQFTNNIWYYPRETKRKSGKPAGTTRDIYDLGALYKSGRDVDINLGPNNVSAAWNWDAKNSTGGAYAVYVHEGIGTNLVPRPWTDDLYYPQKFANSSVRLALKARIKAAFG